MKTYWTTATELQGVDSSNPMAGFQRLGVADDVAGAIESLRYFLRDATQPEPMEPATISVQVSGDAILMTLIDID